MKRVSSDGPRSPRLAGGFLFTRQAGGYTPDSPELLAYREREDALGLTSTAATCLHDTLSGPNTPHSLLPLLRPSIYNRLAGYESPGAQARVWLHQEI